MPNTPFSFWKTTFTATPDGAAPNPAEKLSAEEILHRLVDEDEDHTENTRYILAVMLERQKLLRETDSQRTPNGILRVYEHRKTGEVYLIRDPDIPLAQVEAVPERSHCPARKQRPHARAQTSGNTRRGRRRAAHPRRGGLNHGLRRASPLCAANKRRPGGWDHGFWKTGATSQSGEACFTAVQSRRFAQLTKVSHGWLGLRH